ncbi:MAG: PAS domain S-box protein [Verrucomicrobiota bacterium]
MQELSQNAIFAQVVQHLDTAVAVLACDQAGERCQAIHFVNQAFTELTGYILEEVNALLKADTDASPLPHGTSIGELFSALNVIPEEVSLRRKDGSVFWAHVRMLCEQPDSEYCTLLIKDVSNVKAVQEHQEADREKLAVTLSSIGEGVITADNRGCIDYANREAERLLGARCKDLCGQALEKCFRLVMLEDKAETALPLPQLNRNAQAIGPIKDQLLITESGAELQVQYQLSPILDQRARMVGCVLVFRDIANQVRLEEELQRNQRMESIALLSSGIAHDFNNILTGVLGNISLARSRTEASDANYGKLKSAEKAALRARDLTLQLLSFAKGGAKLKSRVALDQLLREAASFILSGSNSRCELQIPD